MASGTYPTPIAHTDIEVFDPKKTVSSRLVNKKIISTLTLDYLLIPRSAGNYSIKFTPFIFYSINKKQIITKKISNIKLAVKETAQTGATNSDKLIQYLDSPSQVTAQHADIHNAMASFILSTAINAWAKKLYDNDKKLLDQCVETIGIDSDGVAGMTKELYSNEVFAFNKRCNNDTTAIAVKDVIIALQRRGIDQDRLDQALDEATKPKKGNTYYVVGVADA
mgnify:CR=1 FL=1